MLLTYVISEVGYGTTSISSNMMHVKFQLPLHLKAVPQGGTQNENLKRTELLSIQQIFYASCVA